MSLTPADMQSFRDAMTRVLAGEVRACGWGCPPGSHGNDPRVPQQTGRFVVYGYFGWDGRCLYVGQTREIADRCYHHALSFASHAFHAKEIRILANARTRDEARRIEREQIQARDPVCNIQHSPSNHRRRAA